MQKIKGRKEDLIVGFRFFAELHVSEKVQKPKVTIPMATAFALSDSVPILETGK